MSFFEGLEFFLLNKDHKLTRYNLATNQSDINVCEICVRKNNVKYKEASLLL